MPSAVNKFVESKDYKQVRKVQLKLLQAKSLKEFVSKYDTEINVRTSMTDYKKEGWIINIPLYKK